MMQFLSNILGKREEKTTLKSASYFFLRMPEKEQKRLIRKAIANSNKEQQKILREYERKHAK